MSRDLIHNQKIRATWTPFPTNMILSADMVAWMYKELVGNWTIGNAMYNPNDSIIYFEYEDDLVLFKLRWL